MLRITAESKELTLIGNQDHKLILNPNDSNCSISSLAPKPLINEWPGCEATVSLILYSVKLSFAALTCNDV